MIEKWKKQLKQTSGNLTTNQAMPDYLIDKLLEEDLSFKEKLSFEEIVFPKLNGLPNEIKGLNILAGLQSHNKTGALTLFRAIRFPTYKRIHDTVYSQGYAVLNYEQERILDLYKNPQYIEKREKIKNDPIFWTQPQERVVKGLPLFCLANDALQIHKAFRSEEDTVLLVSVHIPHELLENRKIRLIANPAIDLDFNNENRDFEIKDFVKSDGTYEIDFAALRTRGVDLHEMYSNDLPWKIEDAEKLGISQDVFLLDIYKIKDYSKVRELEMDTKTLKDTRYFLHGFFGDQNIFGRRSSEFLPVNCQKISRI